MTKVVSYHLTLIFTCEVEGGYTVNCKELPELITGGDTFDEALENVKDALEATIELYEDFNRELPKSVVSYHFSEEVGNGIEKLIEAVVPMSYNVSFSQSQRLKT